MSYINKILILVFFMSTSFLYAQTPGMNYQAIILNNATIEIPGTDVKENQVPLGLTEVTFRFSISNENEIEYTEDQTVMTDENGMISLIVGEGTPVYASFDDILWDGKLKYLNVEINILSNNEGFVFLDTQKILYIPHSTNGVSGVTTVDTIDEMTPPYRNGDLVWVENHGENNTPTLMIYNGTEWIPVTDDFDPTNELNLLVVADTATRDIQFSKAKVGDQVWNQNCNCMQVYDGTNWVSVGTASGNLTVVANDTARDTEFNPAIVGDQVWNQDCVCMQVYDGTNWVSVGPATGNVAIATTVNDLDSSAVAGDLVWVEAFGDDNIPTLMVYNGTDWVPVNSDFDPRNELDLTVVANETVRDTQFNPAIVGNQVWNQDCGCMQVYDGTNWISMSTITGASNGLNVDSNTIKLGGDLINPTVITTSATNTLAIKDLEVSTATTDELVMIEQSTGVLKRRSLTTLVQQKQIIITGNIGQLRFTTPLPITDLDKIDVYRNGARVSFVMVDTSTIELESEAICYQGDEIRIVQLN